MKRYLFVCGRNRWRSPTAEQVFSTREDVEVSSAGTSSDAEVPLTDEMIEWADIVVVMENVHRRKVQQRHRRALGNKRVVCLDIPDDYAFMDASLIRMLETRMARHFPTA